MSDERAEARKRADDYAERGFPSSITRGYREQWRAVVAPTQGASVTQVAGQANRIVVGCADRRVGVKRRTSRGGDRQARLGTQLHCTEDCSHHDRRRILHSRTCVAASRSDPSDDIDHVPLVSPALAAREFHIRQGESQKTSTTRSRSDDCCIHASVVPRIDAADVDAPLPLRRHSKGAAQIKIGAVDRTGGTATMALDPPQG